MARIKTFAPLLILLVVAGLHYLHRNANNLEEKWSFYLLVGGLLLSLIGILAQPWVGEANFFFIVFSLLLLSFSALFYYVLVSPD